MGPAAEAVMGIPELIRLTPAGFLQRVGAEYQHLAGEVLLGAVTNAMLCSEQIQCLHCLAIKSYEAIQHGGVAPNSDLGIVTLILRNVAPLSPLLIGGAEATIPLEFMQGIGKHPCGAFVAVCRQHRREAVLVQMHSVKAPADGILDGVAAGDVGTMAFPPERKLISFSGLLRRVGIEIGFIHLDISPRFFFECLRYHLS